MSEVPMIYSAICGVMEDIGVVGKGDYNKQQGFKYRGIDAVMNALNPAMIKHKIFCTPEVLEQTREERSTKNGGNLIYSVCRMRYRFYATDGSFVEAIVVGEGMDSGDKATNKAMSIAFKYACFQTFCIPTEDFAIDPDKETPPPSAKVDESVNKGNSKLQTDKEEPTQQAKKEKKTYQMNEERKKLLDEFIKELNRTGYGRKFIIKEYDVDGFDQMSPLQIKDGIKKLKKCPDKAVP